MRWNHLWYLISEELRVGSGARTSNTISDSNAPSGGWVTSSTNKVLVISTPALSTNNSYILDATGKPYQNEIIYFTSGITLYKRTLAHPSATSNRMRTSCPEAVATTSCPADVKLTTKLNAFSFIMYGADDAVTTTASTARSLTITLALSDNAYGRTVTTNNVFRINFRNTN